MPGSANKERDENPAAMQAKVRCNPQAGRGRRVQKHPLVLQYNKKVTRLRQAFRRDAHMVDGQEIPQEPQEPQEQEELPEQIEIEPELPACDDRLTLTAETAEQASEAVTVVVATAVVVNVAVAVAAPVTASLGSI